MNSTTETVFGCLFGLLFLTAWIAPIPLGLRAAKRNHRSPHWMWFGLHPITGWIAFLILRYLPPMKACAKCGENAKAHARVCPYCLTPFNPAELSGIESIAPQVLDPEALKEKSEKSLKTSLLIGRIVVAVICFLMVSMYALVYTIAVLNGNPSRFLVGFSKVPFASPPIIILLTISSVTFAGVIIGLRRFLAQASLRGTKAVMTFIIAMVLASAFLETIAIYGMTIGFMFGPEVSTLTLTMFLATIVGGILVFPRMSQCRAVFDRGYHAYLGHQTPGA